MPPSATSAASAPPGPAQPAELPAAETLTDVLYRLADPAVSGTDKLGLIEGARPADAATLDRFSTALKDHGSLPLSFTAADIGWSDRTAGDVVANVDVTTARADSAGFFFPMEFHPHDGGWQLSAKTAEMLLAFGNARTQESPGATPAG